MNHHEPNLEYGIKMLIYYSKKAKKVFYCLLLKLRLPFKAIECL